MEVCVIIPAYNSAKYLSRAIQSILVQDVSAEVIVVDDASTDSTPAVLSDFSSDPHVKVIRCQTNIGSSGARNLGIRASGAPWVALMDADDESEPDRLRCQLEYLSQAKDVDILGSGAYRVDESGRSVGKWKLGPAAHDAIIGRLPRFEGYAPASSLVFSRSVWQRIGGFDESLRYCEDLDFLLRLVEAGARFGLLHAPLIRYRTHATSKSFSEASASEAFICAVCVVAAHMLRSGPARSNWSPVQLRAAIKGHRIETDIQGLADARVHWVTAVTAARGLAPHKSIRHCCSALRRDLPQLRGLLSISKTKHAFARTLARMVEAGELFYASDIVTTTRHCT